MGPYSGGGCREDSFHSITSPTSTLTEDEEDPAHHLHPLPHSPSTEMSSKMKVITPLYSLSSSSNQSLASVLAPPKKPDNTGARSGTVVEKDGTSSASSSQTSELAPTSVHQQSLKKEQRGDMLPGKYAYQLYPLESTPSQSSCTDVKSSVSTTTSEVDFRNNLASLDADIARLQMQLKVAALQHSPK